MLKLQKALEARHELGKTIHVGTYDGAVSEGKVLNRIIRRTPAGWEMEADMRHGELLVRQLGCAGSRKITTSGVDGEKRSEEEVAEEELEGEEAIELRSKAARIHYVGQDRPEIAYAHVEAHFS